MRWRYAKHARAGAVREIRRRTGDREVVSNLRVVASRAVVSDCRAVVSACRAVRAVAAWPALTAIRCDAVDAIGDALLDLLDSRVSPVLCHIPRSNSLGDALLDVGHQRVDERVNIDALLLGEHGESRASVTGRLQFVNCEVEHVQHGLEARAVTAPAATRVVNALVDFRMGTPLGSR